MIPNIIHFVFGLKPDFGGKPFSLVHYLAVKSAHDINKPDEIYIHYKYEPSGEWWEKARPLITLNKIEPPESIFGRKLVHIAHQADVFRLFMLKEAGGIYLDMDTISVKPLKEFMDADFTIGQELLPPVYYTAFDRVKNSIRQVSLRPLLQSNQVFGLCNAVMMSSPENEFLKKWISTYKTFRSQGKDEFWVEHSVKIPLELSKQFPDQVNILSPYAFHYPLYDPKGLRWLFEKNRLFPNAFIHHLWETESWSGYLKELTIERIVNIDTSYNTIARRFIENIK